jgi:hypothetical protein
MEPLSNSSVVSVIRTISGVGEQTDQREPEYAGRLASSHGNFHSLPRYPYR